MLRGYTGAYRAVSGFLARKLSNNFYLHLAGLFSLFALIDVLFTPGLDGHQVGFAMGETIAHLNHLVALGHMRMIETDAQIRYRRITGGDACVAPAFE